MDAFRAFAKKPGGVRLCLVDDGSTDATPQLLKELTDGAPKVLEFSRLEKNSGKAEAVRHGVTHALERHEPEWVGYWDGDLATPLTEIPSLLERVRENSDIEFLCGSRWLHMGADIQRHLHRHYTGRVFATAASMTLGLPIYDTQCGAKLIRSELAREIFAKPFISRWIFDVELLARTIACRGRERAMKCIEELAVHTWHDKPGSKVSLSTYLRAPFEMWRMKRKYGL